MRQPGGSWVIDNTPLLDMLTANQPWIVDALVQADINPATDLFEFGCFGTGLEEPESLAVYAALALRHPQKLPRFIEDGLARNVRHEPESPAKFQRKTPGHYVLDLAKRHAVPEAAYLPRQAHLWIIAIDPDGYPKDPSPLDRWSRKTVAATHVAVLKVCFKDTLCTSPTFADKVQADALMDKLEALVPDPRNRFALGRMRGGAFDLLPGNKVAEAKAIVAFPPRSPEDMTARLFGLPISPVVALELVFLNEPDQKEVAGLLRVLQTKIDRKADSLARPVLPMFGIRAEGTDAALDVLHRMHRSAVDFKIEGKSVRVTLSTVNIAEEELREVLKARLRALGQ